MMLLYVVLAIIAVLACLAAVGVLTFRLSATRRWRDQVLALEQQARRLAATEQSEMAALPARREREERDQQEQARRAYVDTLAVDELEAFPGIGPATVAKIRQAGFATVGALQS